MSPSTETPSPSRLPFLELLRAVASHLIVWHHLAFYGPLSDVAYPLAPGLIDALYEYGRMAVQVFFVLGGLLTARAASREEAPRVRALGAAAWHRYRRSGLPYLVVLGVAIAANAVARGWMDHESISAPPQLPQVLAHVFFLHDILEYEALTAGIWYLAIDFQLFLLTFLILALAPKLARALGRWKPVSGFTAAQGLFWPLALASLFGFNRHSSLDCWGIYFFGSYFLGMVLQWTLAGRLPRALFWTYAALVVASSVHDWRPRLLVATATALLIYGAWRTGLLERWPRSPLIAYLGRISFSLFLTHFPVCLVVNAAVSRQWPGSQGAALGGMVGAWLLSIGAAVVFHHAVEAPLTAKRGRARMPAAPETSRPTMGAGA
ncbi:acyltransferase family protein [Archangium sp.]|uniref:acyltransferase family protein n=1 Tax=Archangium sp. TaxID=1872627 RepID=UPI00389B1253